ncbi:mycothiol synthase [soil metagenome]
MSVPPFLGELIERARAADGQPPFSDKALVDLRTGAKTALVIGESAVAITSPCEAELVVDPDARGAGLGTELLERVIAASPGELLVWAHGDHPAARRLAATHGFEPVRRLLQLRAEVGGRALRPSAVDGLAQGPVSSQGPGSVQGPEVSSFRVGADDAEWLRVNSRAFAFHAEQGSVSQADLDELLREPWFSSDDFLLIRHGDHIAGYCWLKIEDGIGEFYVVGVDPDHQREGLGRALMAAGFARLAERGIRTAALYVESDNDPAVALYRDLGFTDHTVDIQYRLTR